MDLREIGWKNMDWMLLAQNMVQWRALLDMLMNLNFSRCLLHGVG